MPLTQEQRRLRRDHIGASEVPAIFGLDPWKSAADVYLEKVAEYDGEAPTTEAQSLGHALEPWLIDWAEGRSGVAFPRRGEMAIRLDGSKLSATFDGLCEAGGHAAAEAKVSGAIYGVQEPWGEDLTDEVPQRVTLQTQTQMYVGDLECVFVPAFVGSGRGRVLFLIQRDEDIIREIVSRAEHFWTQNVEKRVMPSGAPPSIQTLKRLRREPASVASIPQELLDEWLRAHTAKSEAENAYDAAYATLIVALGSAEAGEDAGGRRVTYFTQGRTTVDGKRLKSDHPDLFAAYAKDSRFRVLRKVAATFPKQEKE